MQGRRFPSTGILRSIPRAVTSILMAAVALLAAPPQVWGAGPVFTIGNTTFTSTAVGQSLTQNVTLTVNTAVPITSIAIGANFTEYTINGITGCTVDPTGNTVIPATTVCTISVTYTPVFPGSASSPPPISRSAPLLVNDIEGGSPNGYSFALVGSATGSVFAMAPGYATDFAGDYTYPGGNRGCTNQTDTYGDGCLATLAYAFANSIAVDPAGNVYISDHPGYIIQRVDAKTGMITVFAGEPGVQGGFSASGTLATKVAFYVPGAIALDQAGNLYVKDTYELWKINPATGIATIIGGGGAYTLAQAITQGKTALQTDLSPYVGGMLVDPAGNIYFSTYSGGTVYRIDAVTNLISYVAGNGTDAFPATGVPGLAVNAELGQLQGLAMDSNGNLYIADGGNALVYKVNPSGNISIFAGTQATSAQYNSLCANDSGDWGPATSAFVGFPAAVAVDAANNVYIGEPGDIDDGGCPVRRVDAATGIIHTVAGDTTGTYGFLNNAGATETALQPYELAVDGGGNIYVGQYQLEGVVKIIPSQTFLTFPEQSEQVASYQLVTASNVGIGTTLDFSNFPFPIVSSFSPSPYSNAPPTGTDPPDCSSGSLAAGAQCSILVEFYPNFPQQETATATDTIQDDALGVAGTSSVINITGSAFNGQTATLTPINFGSQTVGSPTAISPAQFNIFLNPAITLQTPTITGADESSFSLSTAPSTPCTTGPSIPSGGGFCNIGVIFDPQSSGPLSATLSLTWESKGVPYTITAAITGSGQAPEPAPAPAILPVAGTYNAPVAVEITDSATNPTIDYSTDGTTPSIVYSAPFTLPQTATVMAFANASGDTQSSTTSAAYAIQPYLQFASAQVGVSASQLTATFSLMGNITPTATLHYGHDYSAGAVSCTPTASNLTEVCTVPVTFTPTLPGPRKDALFLMNGSTQVASVLLGGVGQAPLSLVQPGVVTNPILNSPGGSIESSTVDENGTVYVQNNNSVYSVTKAGVVTTLPITGLNGPQGGIAIDGAGILYIGQGDYGSALVTYNTVTGVQGTLSFLPPSPYVPCSTVEGLYGLVVDDIGDVYAFDNLCNQIFELKPNGTYVVDNINPAITQPLRLAVDAAGNIFVSGYAINEIPVTGTQTEINTAGALGGLAVDAADTLYATPYSVAPNGVAMLAASNYQTPLAAIDGGTSGEIESTLGLGLGSDGTLFVGNGGDLDKVDRTQGAINFGEQSVGTASSPQTVAIYNGGNQNLTLSSFAITGTGFALQAAAASPCSNGLVIQPGQLCQVAVTLTPPYAGTFTGTVTFTTNSLNTTSTTQTVNLTGFVYGVYVTASPSPLNFGDQAAGTTSGSKTVTLTNNGILYSASIGIPTVSGYNITGSCSSIAPAGGTCLLTVSFEPTVAQVYDETVNLGVSSSGGGANLTTTFAVTGTGFTPTPTPTPVILPTATPIYNAPIAVEITDSATNPTIDYSTDGTTPSIVYSAPFTLPQTATVMAFANASGDTQSTTTSAAYTIQPYLQFNSAQVGVAAPQLTATVSLMGSATPTATLHYGYDYSLGAVSCTPSASGDTEVCTVPVTFTPTLPGPRKDALIITSGGTTLATVYLGGTGQAPLSLIQPGIVTSPVTVTNNHYIYDSAVGEDGTVYYLSNSTAYSEPKSGGTPTDLNITGLNSSNGSIAIDGAGTLYITQHAYSPNLITYNTVTGVQGTLNMIPPASVYTPCSNTNGGTLENLQGVAVDDLGDVFAGETECGVVFELQSSGSWTVTAITPNVGPNGIAVDAPANGNAPDIFATGNGGINEITYQGQTQINTTGAGTLAVDAAETLFATGYNGGSPGVAELPASDPPYNYASDPPLTYLDPGDPEPLGVSLGSDGTLYVGGVSSLDKVDRTQGAIAFGELSSGNTSPTQTITIYNGGNEGLIISNIVNTGTTDGFAILTGSSSCFATPTTYVTVAPGTLCTIAVNITPPHAGNFTDNIAVTTNSLNTASTTQNIALTGYVYGVYLTVSPNPVPFGTQQTGVTSPAMTATVSNNGYICCGNPNSASISSVSVPPGSAFTPSLGTGPGSCNGAVLSDGQSCQLSITFDPSLAQPYTDTVTVSSGSFGVGPVTFGVTGTGVPPPSAIASLSPSPLAFTPQIANTTSLPSPVTLTNSSAAAATLSYSIALSGAAFASVTDTNACGTTGTLAVGASCVIYVTFTPGSATSFSGSIQVTDNNNAADDTSATLGGSGVSFASQVGTAQATQTVTVGITTAGTPATIQVLTQGGTGDDFSETSGGTCSTTIAYTVGQSCTVNVIFNPLKPGVREGSAELMDGSGNVLGITYLPGLATGPLTVFAPTTQTSLLPASTYTVFGITSSAGGNIFFTDNAGGAVYQMSKSGANLTQIASGLSEPIGVAVDGAGNVYVGGYATGEIVKIPWTGSAYGTQTTVPLGSATYIPYNLTVDGFGNIFFIDYVSPGPVVEVPWTSTGYGPPVTLPFTGLTNGSGVAVDQNGDVFVADSYGHQVLELPWTGTGWGTQVTVVSSSALPGTLGAPVGLTLDPAGDLYVAESHTGFSTTEYLLKVPLNGTTYGTPVIIPMTGLGSITNVALLGGGDIFVADRYSMQVYALDTQDPPTLTFKTTTNVGSTDTTDGPQTATVTNIGNAPLTFNSGTNPNYPTNFPANTLDTNLCASGASILPAASCDISVNFIPNAAGANDAFVHLLNNDLNAATSQKINLSGNGFSPVVNPTASLSPNPIPFGGQVYLATSGMQVATLTNTSTVGITGLSFSLVGANPGDFAYSTTGANGCTTTLAASATCNIYLTFTPSVASSESATLEANFTGGPTPGATTLLTGTGVAFSANVGSTEASQSVTVYITQAGTLNSIQVLTQGAANLDFTEAAGGTCATSTTYSVGQTCTVDVVFNPQFAGVRKGSILLTDSGGNVLATTYLPGTGNGPQISFGPIGAYYGGPVQGVEIAGTNPPNAGVAVDGSGNLYVAQNVGSELSPQGNILEVKWNGATYATPITIATGAFEPVALAIDGNGNLYYSNRTTNTVVELPWSGTAFGTAVTLPITGIGAAGGLAIDASGNLFVVDALQDSANNRVIELPWTDAGFGTQSTVVSGLKGPFGIAVDGADNLYITEETTSTVVEAQWNGSTYGTPAVIYTDPNNPVGLAFDATGDLFVADFQLKELPWNGSSFGTAFVVDELLGGNTSQQVLSVAVDGAGNLYTGMSGINVFKLPAATPPSIKFDNTNVGSTSGDSPWTVTVTNIGNAPLVFSSTASTNPGYPTDFPLSTKGTNLCTSTTSLTESESCNLSIDFTPTSGTLLSEDVVLTDNNLNVSSATQDIPVTGTGVGVVVPPTASLSPSPIPFGGQVLQTTSGTMVATLTNTGSVAISGIAFSLAGTNPADFAYSTTGTNGCTTSLAVNASCSIFVTFTPSVASSESATLQASFTGAAANPAATTSLTGIGVSFSANVGMTEPAQAVTVFFSAAGTLSSIQALTQGTTGLDFTETSGGTCATGTAYTVGQSCTVDVTFAPLAPGARAGSILLTDSSAKVLGIAYLPGIGYAPELSFGTGPVSTLPSYSGGGYNSPLGVTVDAALNVYVADTLNSRIIKIPWTGSAYGTPINVPAGILNQPATVAVDGNGNLFIADTEDNQIVEVPWNGSTYAARVILDNLDLPDPDGIAVDLNGNLFFSDGIDQKVVEMAWTGTGYAAPLTLAQATGLHAPHGLATDSNLNLYIADSGDNQIVELPRTASGFGSEIVLPNTNLFYPQAVAVDAAGDVYIANTNAGTVVELPYSSGSYATQVTLAFSGLQNSNGLAVDAAGNIYVADGGKSDVVKLTVTGPPTLTFANTNVGSTSSDSPKTVPIFNIGNTSDYLPIPASGDNPVYPVNFPLNTNASNLCAADDSIRAGSSCNVSVDFTPTTGGPLSGFVVITDSNLNAASVTHSIPVSGNGESTLTPQTITFTQPTTPITWASGLTVTLVATGGASGNPVVFSIDGTSSGTGGISGSTLSITTPGTFVIDANQAGNSSYSAAVQVQKTLVVNQAPQTINFTPPTSPVTYNAGLTIQLVATGGASGNAVIFSIDGASTATGSISGSTLTVTSAGNFVIDANQAGNTDYLAAPQVQELITVNSPSPQNISFTQPSTPITYAPSLTVALVATGGGSGNPVVFTLDGTSSGTGSISGSTLTITSVGTFVIDANQAGNANYTAAPQVQRTLVVTQAPQVINFTAPSSPVTYAAGLTITLTATGGASGNAVVFSIDSTSTASATVSGNTVTVGSAGNVVIDANQAGNADYTAAAQVQQTVVVNVPPGDFSISASPGSQTVNAGATANYTVTVNSINSFSNSVALSVTGYPSGSTVTFSPPQINPGDGPVTSTLAIVTPAGLFAQAKPSSSLWPIATPTLALLLLLPFRRWRRAFRGRLLMLVLGLASLATAAALTGCGGGFALPQVSQSYTLTVTGTSGSDTHSTTVQLTVQ
ncbi:MAG: choice-of-anchor D domain-containing protein [Terracidiphilus sp.]|jgi:sugar lactone lactonase YvrE